MVIFYFAALMAFSRGSLGSAGVGVSKLDALKGCTKPSECVELPANATCFGVKVPYRFTSYERLEKGSHYWGVQARLDSWEGLRYVPKCWAAIRPMLCSLFLPECRNSTVHLVQKQLCNAVKNQCRIVDFVGKTSSSGDWRWPDFLDCENEEIFVKAGDKDCLRNGDRRYQALLKFNDSGTCLTPYMIPAKDPLSYYGPVDECGLSCNSSFFSEDQHRSVSSLVFGGSLVGLLCSLFAVVTYLINDSWRQGSASNSGNRSGKINNYSNRVIFYMNVCFLVIMIGVFSQFFSETAKESIACRSDGTRRISEPGMGENFYCVVVFVLVYYFAISCCVWSVILVHTLSLIFNGLGKVKHDDDSIEKRGPYFHIVAWSVPLIFTIAIIFMNAIDGDKLSGLCFVSHAVTTADGRVNDPSLVGWFVILPLATTLTANLIFTGTIFYSLWKISKSSNEVISEKYGAKIKSTVTKIVVTFIAPISILIVSTIVHQIYVMININDWDDSLLKFLVCEAKKRSSTRLPIVDNKCEFKLKPSLLRIQLQLICLFAAAILVSSLVWTKATGRAWKRFLLKVLMKYCSLQTSNVVSEKKGNGVRVVKHRLVAQAFSKRKDLVQKGRLSLTFQSTHEDPFDVDKNEEMAEDFSSTWAAALPRLVQRRNALVGAEGLGLKRAMSEESLNLSRSVSIRSKRFSYDSRRHSFVSNNSQFSVNQSELDHLQKLYKTSVGGRKLFKKPKFKRRSNRITDSSCNGSVTSQDPPSNASSVRVIPAITLDPRTLENASVDKHISKMKEKLGEGMFQVPPPGRSIDFSSRVKKIDDTEFIELQERLKTLTASQETYLSESAGNFTSVQVQTSLTDLESLGKKPNVKDASTQDDLPRFPYQTPTSTTSSSQTEFNALLRKKGPPVDAHVVTVRIDSGDESSSIPSSYEARSEVVVVPNPDILEPGKMLKVVPPPLTKAEASHSSSRHHYNRGRRGGISDDRPSAVKLNTTPIGPIGFKTGHTLEEVEFKARTPKSYDAKLQTLPDTIVAISTPSS